MLATTEVRTKERRERKGSSSCLFWSKFHNQSTKIAPAPLATPPTPTVSSPTLKSSETANNNIMAQPPSTHHSVPGAKTTAKNDAALAIDCEMVGVGLHASVSVLARVSIVNLDGQVVYDQFVKVEEKVTDYRTCVSGIRKEDLELSGISYGKCRAQVRRILLGKILVGHGLQNDLEVLNLRHPHHLIRDTSLYLPYMKDFGGGVVRSRSLRDLSREFCGRTIQSGEHDSIEDARAAMALFVLSRREWDEYAAQGYNTTTAQHHHHQSSFYQLYNPYMYSTPDAHAAATSTTHYKSKYNKQYSAA